MKKTEQPGPGSYHNEDASTIAATVKPHKALLNTISSMGRTSNGAFPQTSKKNITAGSRMFKDSTVRGNLP